MAAQRLQVVVVMQLITAAQVRAVMWWAARISIGWRSKVPLHL